MLLSTLLPSCSNAEISLLSYLWTNKQKEFVILFCTSLLLALHNIIGRHTWSFGFHGSIEYRFQMLQIGRTSIKYYGFKWVCINTKVCKEACISLKIQKQFLLPLTKQSVIRLYPNKCVTDHPLIQSMREISMLCNPLNIRLKVNMLILYFNV